jgi:DNA helicase-2/ATP-dependent DNA helicase PcrA
VAARFAEETEGGTLSAFLAYLAAAEEEERGLTPGDVEVGRRRRADPHRPRGQGPGVGRGERGRALRGRVPGPPKASDHWLKGMGVLPFPLRGDAVGLPRLKLETASDGKGVRTAMEEFDEDWKAHQEREERPARLRGRDPAPASVAVQRLPLGRRAQRAARAVGLPAGGGACAPTAPARSSVGRPLVEGETNPTLAEEVTAEWPLDPLAERRAAVLEGARWSRRPLAAGPLPAPVAKAAAAVALEAELLLAERDRSRPPRPST